ncbi:MAG: hypothetical protein L0Y72_24420 [Gemmataceae bacterium]|nr:hypothetical protein [Gemmataceae bacterium]MCI0742191.1 hypothetical protein [Gemmataceae bacterium]
MAETNPTLEFNEAERKTVAQLGKTTSLLASALLLLGVALLAGGVYVLLFVSGSGILNIIQGLVTVFLGLILVTSARDLRFMVETKYTAIHLGNALGNLAAFQKTQFTLAILLIVVAGWRLFWS